MTTTNKKIEEAVSVVIERERPKRKLPVHYLTVDLGPKGYDGFSLQVRTTLTPNQLTALAPENPESVAFIYADHNLCDEEGEDLPPGGTLEFAQACPYDIQMYAIAQAVSHIMRGGRSEPEKNA